MNGSEAPLAMSGASLPSQVAQEVARALSASGKKPLDRIAEVRRVGGGCIHPAARIDTSSGRRAFLKWADEPGASGFEVEGRGLEALRARGGVPVPGVLGASTGDATRRGWLLLEWIEPGAPSSRTDPDLGRGLANLHRPFEGKPAGWHEDGWIATLPQANPPDEGWPRFWAEARLEPQWRLARERGRIAPGRDADMDRLLDGLPDLLEDWAADGIGLLHGDLWGGNVLVGQGGRAYLVDPAVYRGHREVDLAMMELFGGFGERVFSAYREARPVEPGYREARRDVYQLYPLLVHVNLFGGGYVRRALSAIDRILAHVA